MTAFLDMWSPGRLPAANPLFNSKCLSSTEAHCQLKFMERMVSVDRHIREGCYVSGGETEGWGRPGTTQTFSTKVTAVTVNPLFNKTTQLGKTFCMSNQNDWALPNALIVNIANLPFEHPYKKATNRGLNKIIRYKNIFRSEWLKLVRQRF